jgi:putative spermidine/putrescine transport system permease protein
MGRKARADGADRNGTGGIPAAWLGAGAWLSWPTAALGLLAIVPLTQILRISVAGRDATGLWSDAFTLDAYRGLIDPQFAAALVYSVWMAMVVAAASVGLGFPLTWLITRMGRRAQVAWLIFLLATLTLSDVLIAFAWQVMLSKRIGLSNVLVMFGLLDRPASLAPGGGAVIASLIYMAMPFTVLTLYPPISRLSPSLLEAARTLGASPARAFRTVVIPLTRRSLLVAFFISTVLTIGAYVSPIVLGTPRNWTLAVLIGNAALAGHDIPRAAAMSVCLLTAIALIGGAVSRFARARITD